MDNKTGGKKRFLKKLALFVYICFLLSNKMVGNSTFYINKFMNGNNIWATLFVKVERKIVEVEKI